jgi:hypothetical protein
VLDCEHLAGLRREHLFDLASICHMSPAQVDATALGDFAVLIENCAEFRKEKQAQAG